MKRTQIQFLFLLQTSINPSHSFHPCARFYTILSAAMKHRLLSKYVYLCLRARQHDDYDGQMIFGDLVGLKFPDIRLTGEEKPRKNLTQKTCPDWGSNPGPLHDRRACYHLLHCSPPEVPIN